MLSGGSRRDLPPHPTPGYVGHNLQSQKSLGSTCYMCTEDCPITVVTDGDEVVSIEHPDCLRAEGMMEQRNSPLRWITPRVRARHDEPWAEVSRAKAVGTAADRLRDIRDQHGPGSK